MTQWVDRDRVTVVPTGGDLAEYRPHPANFDPNPLDPSAPLVTFVGAMDWEPNIDGVEYFCGEIWRSIKAEVPQARFRIVGRNPGRRVQKWASNSMDGSIEVTGRVPSVVEHLHQSAVVIVPLRIGGGTRLKIYEAMAAAKSRRLHDRWRRRPGRPSWPRHYAGGRCPFVRAGGDHAVARSGTPPPLRKGRRRDCRPL